MQRVRGYAQVTCANRHGNNRTALSRYHWAIWEKQQSITYVNWRPWYGGETSQKRTLQAIYIQELWNVLKAFHKAKMLQGICIAVKRSFVEYFKV